MLATDVAETVTVVAAVSLRPVSGRYEGEMSLPQPGRFLLDLRIDIDSATANSAAMNRISGDLYQVSRITLPGQPARLSRTYIESWIVDRPQVESSGDHIDITGNVRFWTGTHAATTVAVRVSRDNSQFAHAAMITFTETGGGQRSFTCRRVSESFRDLELEIDVCASVNQPPLIPDYDTNWHDDRPVDLPQRTLTIEGAYREMGVSVTIDPSHTVIDDSAPAFQSWTPAELHDAMETHFSRFTGEWPKWAMWGLLAGEFERPAVGGVMFDAAAGFGGAGEGPERQGFAVFRNHEWFGDLVAGPPQNQDQAWSIRHFLYTWVHEAGHAFNFLHSWDKGRPDSLSWMNYDWRYEQRNGPDTFWSRFAFRFDDDELIHVRHGNRASVIMGGDPWSSGSHLEAPNLAMAQIEGDAPVELLIRSKRYFELMEPVIVELRLRNLMTDIPIVIDKRLAPEFGGVVVYIQKPDGAVVKYEPVMCALGTPEAQRLSPYKAGEEGDDRYSREVFLSYGANGFYFDQPGEYRIRATYQGFGDILIPSNAHRIRIAAPLSKEADRLAQGYFSDVVGLSLYLQGSRSPYLAKGVDLLEELADRFKNSMLGANIAMALAYGAARPFFRIEEPGTGKMVQTAKADPARALKLTDPALGVLQAQKDKATNLAYGRLVRRRAEYHKASDSQDDAHRELRTLQKDLAERGANESVLRRYETLATGLGSAPGRRAGRTRSRTRRSRTRR